MDKYIVFFIYSFVLFFLKNQVISNKVEFSNLLLKKIFNTKFLIIVFFYIFAFFWNPKTVITGDIATNSLYKIVYKSTKIIFKFESPRFFEDSFLIKFHKKYIE